jgi:S1-C subfamily serine protease/pSer/pThr/pTyr-binding forkhead associated (FHA) protein
MWLVIESGSEASRSVRVEGERFTIGSADDAGLRIEHPDVEPVHATIRTRADGRFELHDEGAREGVFVEGERVTDPVALNGDEKLRLGDDVLLRLSLEEPESEPAIEVPSEAVPELADALGVEPEELAPAGADPAVRRRRWRAVLGAIRETRRAVRRALVAAAAALAAALVLAVLVVTGVVGGGDDDRGAQVEDVVEQASPSTVLVRARLRGREATGSGFALDTKEGLVVTNFHVINGGRLFDVRVGEEFRPAEVVGAAPCDDLALLKVDDSEGMRALQLGAQSELRQGQQVVALGFPQNPSLRGELTSTAGVISVPRSSFRLPTPDSPHFENLIQTDAALNPGNSGGPLLDADARLVGVNTAIFAAPRGPASAQGYAIGVDRVKQVTAELRRGRSQRWLGTGLLPPPRRVLRRAGRPGLLVTTAVPGTAAAAIGLEGVLLTALNDQPLDGTIADYCRAMEGTDSGEVVEVEAVVEPGGAPKVLEVELD